LPEKDTRGHWSFIYERIIRSRQHFHPPPAAAAATASPKTTDTEEGHGRALWE